MHHAVCSVCEIWIYLYVVKRLVLRAPLRLLAVPYFEVLLFVQVFLV